MYYFYNTMAKIYRCTIVSKEVTLGLAIGMPRISFFTHIQIISRRLMCQILSTMLKRAVEKRMLPNYAAYVQHLLCMAAPTTALVGRKDRHAFLDLPLHRDAPRFHLCAQLQVTWRPPKSAAMTP
jgi:hypothetical protein